MYHECQAHHITIAEKRGVSQKVSDCWTIPLCYAHHSQLHHTGERLYWQKLGIDPMVYATLYVMRQAPFYYLPCVIHCECCTLRQALHSTNNVQHSECITCL